MLELCDIITAWQYRREAYRLGAAVIVAVSIAVAAALVAVACI